MSKINRLPKGLQEFLGNTAQGQNPDELSQTVVPTLEMQQYHALDQMKWVQATRTITTTRTAPRTAVLFTGSPTLHRTGRPPTAGPS